MNKFRRIERIFTQALLDNIEFAAWILGGGLANFTHSFAAVITELVKVSICAMAFKTGTSTIGSEGTSIVTTSHGLL